MEQANAAFEGNHLDMDICREALGLAARAHYGQCRSSDGSPFVFHPIAVATVIAQWGWGQDAVLAGLLHDVVEDSHFELTAIESSFGHKVAALVAACTKDARIECKTSRAADLQMRLRPPCRSWALSWLWSSWSTAPTTCLPAAICHSKANVN